MSLPLTFASDFIRLNFIAVETVVHPFVSVFLICFGLRRLLKISQSFPPISHTEFTGIFTTGHTHSCPRPILSFLDGDSVEDQGACQGPDCTPGLAPLPLLWSLGLHVNTRACCWPAVRPSGPGTVSVT